MTFEELQREMNEYWTAATLEAEESKDSMLALDRLVTLYRRFDPSDRELADRVIAEWLDSSDEARRFDAIALIREFEIQHAVPALRDLRHALLRSSDPGAAFEREKVEDLLAELRAT